MNESEVYNFIFISNQNTFVGLKALLFTFTVILYGVVMIDPFNNSIS